MKKDFVYINPKDLKDLDVKLKIPPCACPWHRHLFPWLKHKPASIPVCPITNIEMQMDVITVSLRLLTDHIDRQKMKELFEELLVKSQEAKCTCV